MLSHKRVETRQNVHDTNGQLIRANTPLENRVKGNPLAAGRSATKAFTASSKFPALRCEASNRPKGGAESDCALRLTEFQPPQRLE
jgi:hypothetical protein